MNWLTVTMVIGFTMLGFFFGFLIGRLDYKKDMIERGYTVPTELE